MLFCVIFILHVSSVSGVSAHSICTCPLSFLASQFGFRKFWLFNFERGNTWTYKMIRTFTTNCFYQLHNLIIRS